MDFKLGRAGTSKTSAILVVSPLVSLMVDQVEDLRRKTSIMTSGRLSWRDKPVYRQPTVLCT